MTAARVLVIGAGPAGLAASACLRALHIESDLVDRRGVQGGAYAAMDPDIELASPNRYNNLPGLALAAAGEYTRAAAYRAYLHRYAEHHRLEVQHNEVRGIGRDGSRFEADIGDGRARRYDAVVVASGAFDHPKRLDIPGLADTPRNVAAPQWRASHATPGLRMLVIGAATSAVEIAEEAAARGALPTVSARSGRVRVGARYFLGRDVHDFAFLVERLPARWGGKFCRGRQVLPAGDRGFRSLQRAGRVKVRPEVVRFEGGTAVFVDGSRDEFDAIVMAAGYRYSTPYLPAEIARREPNESLAALDNESISWPGLYVVGHACARGLDSQFLRGIARDAPRVARRIASRLAA